MFFKKKNKQEVVHYWDVLNEQQLKTIGFAIKDFEKGKITYQKLKEIMKFNCGIELKPWVRDFSTVKMTIQDAEKVKERIKTENFIAKDLEAYYISGYNFQNVVLRNDRKMIEVLAKNGDEEAQATLDYIWRRWEHYGALYQERQQSKRNRRR